MITLQDLTENDILRISFQLGERSSLPLPATWRELPSIQLPEHPDSRPLSPVLQTTASTFPVVILGGTFDHLHAGHKILLSMAAWITDQKIIVGVTGNVFPPPLSLSVELRISATDDTLLTKKTYKEYLEPLDVRIKAVRDFLAMFKPGLIYDVVPINDVCGPAGWDPDIQALVVSKETLPGAATSKFFFHEITR